VRQSPEKADLTFSLVIVADSTICADMDQLNCDSKDSLMLERN
jgi:hypothetical protein